MNLIKEMRKKFNKLHIQYYISTFTIITNKLIYDEDNYKKSTCIIATCYADVWKLNSPAHSNLP